MSKRSIKEPSDLEELGGESIQSEHSESEEENILVSTPAEDTNKIERDFFTINREQLFCDVPVMGFGPTGPDQVTTAVTLAGALKFCGVVEEAAEMVNFISDETFEENKNTPREERIKQLVNEKAYRRFREQLCDFVHLILGSCSNNTASNLVEYISLRGRYLGLDQVAGDSHVNAIFSFASVEDIKLSSHRKFQSLRDPMINPEAIRQLLHNNSASTKNIPIYRIVMAQKASKFSIDWEPSEELVAKSTTASPLKQPEDPDVLYLAITSRNGLLNTPTKFVRNEQGQKEKKTYAFLEAFLVAQFRIKPKTESKVIVRKR